MKKQRLYVWMNFLTIACVSSFVFCGISFKKQQAQPRQWLWNTAKVIGPLAMMGFVAYQLLKSPSEIIELPKIKEVKVTPAQQQPLTKEQYEKYKNAANIYGYTTVALSWAMLLSGSPLFVPIIAASYGGALYNSMKGLQLKLQPYVYPISLEQIQIKPEEMPY